MTIISGQQISEFRYSGYKESNQLSNSGFLKIKGEKIRIFNLRICRTRAAKGLTVMQVRPNII